ncbi:arrestin domain-containing protein 2-like [Centruroides sculpturatus]|uniref:arrestin domain-containing protein 2-like n=1 Tax=Centruroides sculpturatus TaxID=218467 RepID=UPI000C6DE0AC|nr:arrestin domain-containing protein 2-like [Centruroides sculpturatus]
MGKIKTFEIVLDSNKTVYYPGQQVLGKCVVDLRGDMKMKTLRIYMRGVAKVHWTESRSTGNRLGAYTEHYNAEIEYFFKRQVLFGTGESIAHNAFINNNVKSLLSAYFSLYSIVAFYCYLHTHYTHTHTHTHTHTIKYFILLSKKILRNEERPNGKEIINDQYLENEPNSGISTSFEGKYGSVRYWLKAEMEKPWSFNHKTKKAFTVISPIDINRTEYLMPVENSVEKTLCCWCCTSGPITLYARTDRKGYCPGESIAITADFENHSSRTIIPHATLHQTQTFLAGGKSRSRRCKFTIVTGLAIQPGRTANWDAQLLKIPAVSPSIINCCLIRVDYAVRITLQIPGAYNLSVDLPVVIGTVPLRTRPPHYRNISPQLPEISGTNGYILLDAIIINLFLAPPTYAECVEGSVDITEDDDGDIIGDTRFTPMYAYVHDYNYQPPPAYSEVDPHPTHSSDANGDR